MEEVNEMFEDLDEKLKHSWRLRMYHRWTWLKLEISEWWYWLLEDLRR